MSRLLACLVVLSAAPLAAQPAFEWYGRGPYRAAVPRPDSLLGHPIGSRHTMFHQQQQVLDRMIAAAPDRVRTEIAGRTAEGRALRLIIISAPENIARLDQIRRDLAALADPRATTPQAAAAIAQRTPAVAMLSHSIHGNEPAGFETAMMTVYQLLASGEPATLEILKNVVTVINPTMNPDGHERFAAWNNSVAVASDDPAALEQSEPWSIMGRVNHYRFDMNRDVLAQSQLETKAIAAAVVRWHPQVFVDLHSTTGQYFFAPAALPINANLPAKSRDWLERIGRGNAAAFDRFSWQYYVRDVFDLFYAGYWDSWPSLNGATGMTYETDGGPELRLRKGDGTVMTFADGIAHHLVASLATLGTLAAGREERLQDYYQFRVSGMAEVAARPFRRVVIGPGNDPDRALKLARLLAGQDIEVVRTTAPLTVVGARDYLAGAAATRTPTAPRRGGTPTAPGKTFPAGTLVIDLDQPQARLATALLEPASAVDSAFARRQYERFERNRRRGASATREGYEFYDVTAWSLPLAYGLDAYWTDDTSPVTGERVGADLPATRGRTTGRAQSAYLWAPGTTAGARLAMILLREGFTVGAASEELRADGVTYPAGTFVARIQRNGAGLHDRIAAVAAETGALVTAVQSAFPDLGKVGVGSEGVDHLKAAKILLGAGDGVSHTSFGSAWFYLEKELGIPVTPIDLAALGRVDLNDYSVLILPDGFGAMGDRLQGASEALKQWVRRGGAVIGFGGATTMLARKEIGLTTVSEVGREEPDAKKDAAPADTTKPSSLPLVSATAPKPGKPEGVPGLIAKATLDRTHWLTFGYQRAELPVLINGDVFMTPSKEGDNPVVLLGDDIILAGFTWPNNTERLLKGSAWAVVENVGAGKVILFAEDPLFRAFWRGTAGLFNNALLFGPGR
ncbi:MAG: M14 family zinc carboxypeptidase [Gemmatimonadales bacterium]